ncbi:MAG: DUF72 domain-containing protein [Acidobacteriota bacterium]
MQVLIGTSGWNYPGGKGTWNGVFYPTRRPKGFDELAYYAEHFNTVEVNSTFYRSPDPAAASAWLRRTPPSFLFSVKLYQKFTHPDMYLKRPGVTDWDVSRGDLDAFRLGIDPMAAAGRLAALLLQFPPSFHATPETRGYLDWLASALKGYPLAVELRHRSWSDDAEGTRALLKTHDAAWVWIDEPKFESSVRQSGVDIHGGDVTSVTAGDGPGLTYLRLHGRNAARWWEHNASEDRYDYLYSPDELAPVGKAAARAANAGRRVLTYFNNHFSAKAVANAAVLKHQLGDLVPGDYPREMVDRYPELDGIVRTTGLPL